MLKFKGVEYDPFTQITTKYYTEELENGRIRIHMKSSQPVDAVLKMNQEQMNEHGKSPKFGDGGTYHTARIPSLEIERWMRDYGFNWFQADDKEKKRWLQRPEFKKFRTINARMI